jgi:hypothetical protein
MRRILRHVRRHWLVSATVVIALVGVSAFVLVWFQPQKLFINKTVNEPFPAAVAPAAQPMGQDSRSPRPLTGRTAFISRGHGTSGTVSIYRLPDGSRLLRLESLRTSNGPDVRVRLSVHDVHAPNDAIDDGIVDLGGLKGNRGNQNYRIPSSVRLTDFRSVILWCRRFSYVFGAAPLSIP